MKNKKIGKLKYSGKMALIAIIIAVSAIILSLQLSSASFAVGNSTIIEQVYAPGEIVRGWLNISLANQPSGSLLGIFDSSVPLIDFLRKTNVSFSCSVSGCSSSYLAAGEKNSVLLTEGQEYVLGFNISSSAYAVSQISKVHINIATDAGEYCPSAGSLKNPLKIDVLADNSSKPEFYSGNSVSTICGEKSYGCYDSSADTLTKQIDNQNWICEKIFVGPGAGVRTTIELSGSGPANFTVNASGQLITARNTDYTILTSEFNLPSENYRNVTVCIKALDASSSGKYSIKYESEGEICGYAGAYAYDFPISAQPLEYARLGNTAFDLTGSNATAVFNYISSKYGGSCLNGCVIPIKIISGQAQTISLAGSYINYTSGGNQFSSLKIYDLIESPSLITMPFRRLSLSSSGLAVPSIAGNHSLILSLDNIELARSQITVKDIPVVDFVLPFEVSAFSNTSFFVYVSGKNITTYKWNFGDGTPEQITSINKTFHRYSAIGSYNLNVTALNSAGASSKVFTIKVSGYSPSYISSLQKSIASVKSQINALPSWYKSYVSKTMNINATEYSLNKALSDYNRTNNFSAFSAAIAGLKFPYMLNISEASSGLFIMDSKIINFNSLSQAGAGRVDSSQEGPYKDAIFEWASDNLIVEAKESVYSSYSEDGKKDLGSYFSISINSRAGSIDKLYFAINANKDDIIFKDNYTVIGSNQTTIVVLSGVTSKDIEFFVKKRISPAEMPLYFSPDFSKLSLIGVIGVCNNNGKCEKSAGEDSLNCANDCKTNIGFISIWIAILLVIALAVYIILQEWYKRKYESHLFKNKDELYNLINFMSNSEKQGISKDEMFKMLESKKWSKEQIRFAYNRFKGKRTGMYEIPIFRFSEKKKVQEELAKRQKTGNLPSKPGIFPNPVKMPIGMQPKQPLFKK